MGAASLDHLRRPDGAVLVPPEVASGLLRLVVLGGRELVRRDGGAVSPALLAVLFALHAAAERQDQAAEANALVDGSRRDAAGSSGGTLPDGCVTVKQAARSLGASTGYTRRLARRGLLQGRRAGPVWLIDAAALEAFQRRRNDERSGVPGGPERR